MRGKFRNLLGSEKVPRAAVGDLPCALVTFFSGCAFVKYDLALARYPPTPPLPSSADESSLAFDDWQ